MITYIVLPLIVILSSFIEAGALEEAEAKKIYEESKAAARNHQPSLKSLTKGAEEIDAINSALQSNEGAIKHQATELGSLPSEGEKAKESTSGECTKEGCSVSGVMSVTTVNQREVKLEELGFRKDKDQFPENTKGYLDKVNHKVKEFSKGFDSISGTYKDCKPIEKEFSYKEKTTCDEYYDVKYNNCPITQVVEIDPKYTYQCSKKRIDAIKTCHDEITSITCKKAADCDNGGIIPTSVKSDMQFTYNYPTLLVGAIKDNNWCGDCKTVDKVTEFEVRNKEKITEFLLTEAGYDDHLWVQLNGQTIYIGSRGGDKLEIVNRDTVSFGSGGHDKCERGRNWRFGNINKDLRPFLKEGKNVLFMRTIVAGCGEGWIKIRAKQHCCNDWDIKRETKCSLQEEA